MLDSMAAKMRAGASKLAILVSRSGTGRRLHNHRRGGGGARLEGGGFGPDRGLRRRAHGLPACCLPSCCLPAEPQPA